MSSPHLPPNVGFGGMQSPGAPDAVALLATVQTQQQQIAQLHQLMQQMQQHIAQQPPPQAPHQGAPRQERPRLPAPPSFDGKGSALDAWEAEIRKQIVWYRTPLADEVSTATAFLSDAAYDWWTHLQSASKGSIVDLTSLVSALRGRFQPVTTAEMARVRISKLTQGKSSINDYVAAFRKLLTSLSTMSEDDRLFNFVRGLKPEIATQIRVQGVKTLEAAIEMASRMGTMGEYGALAAAAAHGRAADGHGDAMDLSVLGLDGIEGLEAESTSASSFSSSKGVSLEQFQLLLAAMRDGRRPLPGKGANPKSGRFDDGRFRYGELSRAEMDAHYAAGTCFVCGKAGHRANKCKKGSSTN